MSNTLNTAQTFALKALKAALQLATVTGLFDILFNHQKRPDDINVFCDLVGALNDGVPNPIALTTEADFHQAVGEFAVDTDRSGRCLHVVQVWDMDRDFLGLFFSIPNGMDPENAIVLLDAAVKKVKLEHPDDYSADDVYAELAHMDIRPITLHKAGETW